MRIELKYFSNTSDIVTNVNYINIMTDYLNLHRTKNNNDKQDEYFRNIKIKEVFYFIL